MHPPALRHRAVRLLLEGMSPHDVARVLGVPRRTVADWSRQPNCVRVAIECPRCDGTTLDEPAYAELLGWYLGDGYLALARRRVWVLRVVNDARYPVLNDRIHDLMTSVRPGGRSGSQQRSGCVVTSMGWKHWACLFPQHGPGRKHERAIILESWQRLIVEQHPDRFLRGLFHSDGSRVKNWATRMVAGEKKRYDYPRWQFTNHSEDILGLCCWALDLAEIAWRRSSRTHVSVSRREAVARLDALIGVKS